MLKHKAFISRSSAYKGGVCVGPEGEANGCSGVEGPCLWSHFKKALIFVSIMIY